MLVVAALGLVLRAAVADAAALQRPRTIDELKARVAAVLERQHVPGVGLALVTRDGLLWAGGVGLADRDAKRPVTADTMFRVGSITKSFVALALVKLSEEGRIDLNAPVSTLAQASLPQRRACIGTAQPTMRAERYFLPLQEHAPAADA